MKRIGLVGVLACTFLASACGGAKQETAQPLYVHVRVETLDVISHNPAIYSGAEVSLLDHNGSVIGTATLEPGQTAAIPGPLMWFATDIYSQATSGDDFLVLIDGCSRPAAFTIMHSDRTPGSSDAQLGSDGRTYISPPGDLVLFSPTASSCHPVGSDEEAAWAAFKAKWGDPKTS